MDLNTFIFNKQEIFERMSSKHTKTSFKIAVLVNSILLEFLYTYIVFYKKI